MKCPACERGTLFEISGGRTVAYQCDRCKVTVPHVTELSREQRHPWRRGYKVPVSRQDASVSALTSYARTKEDKA